MRQARNRNTLARGREVSPRVLACLCFAPLLGCDQTATYDGEPEADLAPLSASQGWQPPPPSLPPAPPGATCVTIQRGLAGDVHDSEVAPGYGNWATGAYPGLWTGLSSSNHWTLVRPDLSPIPAGAQIVLATFSIHAGWSDKPGTVRAHRITAAWNEQTTTFASFGGAASWDPAPLGSFDPQGQGGYRSIDVTALAQSWHAGSTPNHGLLLEEDPVAGNAHYYYSSESSSAAYRPRLDVCFVTGGACQLVTCPPGQPCSQDACDSPQGQSGTLAWLCGNGGQP